MSVCTAVKRLRDDWDESDEHNEWGKYRMMFGDVGGMCFLIDKRGNVTWAWDCY